MLPNAQGVPKSGFQLVLGQSLVSIGLKSHLTLYDHQLDCSSHTAFSPTHSYTTCLISCNSFHFTWTHQLTFMLDVGWLCSVLRPRQHSIGYMGDGFYRSKDPTNSIKVLKEMLQRKMHIMRFAACFQHNDLPSLHVSFKSAPPPFRPSDSALCGSHPLVTPY